MSPFKHSKSSKDEHQAFQEFQNCQDESILSQGSHHSCKLSSPSVNGKTCGKETKILEYECFLSIQKSGMLSSACQESLALKLSNEHFSSLANQQNYCQCEASFKLVTKALGFVSPDQPRPKLLVKVGNCVNTLEVYQLNIKMKKKVKFVRV